MNLSLMVFAATSFLQAQPLGAGESKIAVEANRLEHMISPTLFRVLFEDISLSASGGIYPEPILNRSFEHADTLQTWKFQSADGKGAASISTADVQARPPIPPLHPFNRSSLRIQARDFFKVENNGYRGMNTIRGSIYALRLGAQNGKSGDSILKVVSAADEPVRTRIDPKGAGALSGKGQTAVLTSASPVDEKHLGRTDKGFANR